MHDLVWAVLLLTLVIIVVGWLIILRIDTLKRLMDLYASAVDVISSIYQQSSRLQTNMVEELSITIDELRPQNLARFWADHGEWSESTFGSTAVRGPRGPMEHLKKEIDKEILPILVDPDQLRAALYKEKERAHLLEEYADCILLIFDSCRRARFRHAELVAACYAKLEKNKARVWPTPSAVNADQAIEHDRSGE